MALLTVPLAFPVFAQSILPPLNDNSNGQKSLDLGDLPNSIIACSKIPGSEKRITCYDELSSSVEEKVRSMVVRNQFAWMNKRIGEREPKTLTVSIPSTDGIWNTDSITYRNSMFFTMTCKSGNMAVYIAFPEKVSETSLPVKLTSNDKTTTITMDASVNGTAMGFWGWSSSREFVSQAMNSNLMTFSFKFPDKDIMATFDLNGIQEQGKQIFSECSNK